MPLSVGVLSRYAVVRAGLTSLIRAHPQRAVVVESAAHDGHLGDLDVVVYDVAGLVDATGLQDLEDLLAKCPVLGLGREDRDELTDRARELGVQDTVPETVTADHLIDALEVAAGGTAYGRRKHDPVDLSERERDILGLVGAGMTNQAIADELALSVNSVKTYVRTAFRKIGASNRTEAAVWAIRHRLTPMTE